MKEKRNQALIQCDSKEPLQPRAVVRQLTDPVEHEIDDLLADRVVPTSEVVRCILLTGDELLGVEELTVGACAHLIDHGRLQIYKDSSRNVLASTRLRKEGVEGIVTTANSLVGRHLSIRLDAVFQAKQLPTRISDLDTSLPDVDADGFTHDYWIWFWITAKELETVRQLDRTSSAQPAAIYQIIKIGENV